MLYVAEIAQYILFLGNIDRRRLRSRVSQAGQRWHYTRHAPNIPSWLKIICTVRTQLLDCAKQLPYTRISLDKTTNDAIGNSIAKDLSDYVGYRLAQSPSIQSNVTASVNGKAESSCNANQTRFSSHLLTLARGSFLFAKLTLDLIESGHLVAKSASYKVHNLIFQNLF